MNFNYFIINSGYTNRFFALNEKEQLKHILTNDKFEVSEFIMEGTEIVAIIHDDNEKEIILDQKLWKIIQETITDQHKLDGTIIIYNKDKMPFSNLCSIIDLIGTGNELSYCRHLSMRDIDDIDIYNNNILYVQFATESG